MTTPAAAPRAAAPLPPNALRVVLFGMPDAGKTSLLGALAQAAQTQERALEGRLSDLWHGLAELQRRVYDEKPRETLEEIVPYPVGYEPFQAGKPDPSQRLDVVLYDCDGRVANAILTQQQPLDDSRSGKLAAAVTGADALVLVVDGSATHEQIDSDLTEFVQFLELFEQRRGRRSEVGQLPVFLVLTKCDLLAHKGDNQAEWTRRVDEKKAEVEARFKEFLEGGEGPGGFGSLDLSVVATAVRRPRFTGTTPPTRDPVGVADLFKDVFHSARDFRSRVVGSQRRLAVTVIGAGVLVLAMGGAAAALYFNQDAFKPIPLVSSVESFRSREGLTVAERLTEPLQRKISELDSFKKNPEFAALPPELRDYIDSRLNELSSYRDFREKVRAAPPSQFLSVERLTEYRNQLQNDLAPPKDYAAEWVSTDAALLRDKWIADSDALLAAAARLADWYRELRFDAERLLILRDAAGKPLAWPAWQADADRLFARAEQPPFNPKDRIPESRELPSARAETYATVFTLDTVAAARREWEAERARVERLRDVAAAVGLLADADDRRAPLKLPDVIRPKLAADRLGLLKDRYPKHTEWKLDTLTDVAAAEVRAAAQASYDRLIRFGQQMVLDEFNRVNGDGEEKPESWEAVARWLSESTELRDANELALVLLRLLVARPDGPVPALEAFLKLKGFALRVNTVHVEIPDRSPGNAPARLRPFGNLVLTVQGSPYAFLSTGEPERDARNGVTKYAFSRSGGVAITYLLKQELKLELAVGANKDRVLSWDESRTLTYQFERLLRSPWLHRPGEDSRKGVAWRDVTVTFSQDGTVPRVPDLLPAVKPR